MDFLSRALAFELRSTGLGSREKIHSCLVKGTRIPQTDLRWKESLSDHGQILHDRPVEWLASSVRVRSSGPRKQETVLAGPPSPLR